MPCGLQQRLESDRQSTSILQPIMKPDNDDQSSQSSNGEAYDELPSNEIQMPHAREFAVYRGGFPWREIELFAGDQPAYFCELSAYTFKKPDLTLRKGTKDGTVVGACHFRRSRSLTCGVGTEYTSMNWVDMQQRGALKLSAFEFEWAGSHYTIRKAKTAEVGVSGVQGLLQTHFKVVDNASGSIVGLYVSDSGVARRKGTLKIATGVTEDLELLIILGTMSWRAKISRDRKHWAAASGGGAGG